MMLLAAATTTTPPTNLHLSATLLAMLLGVVVPALTQVVVKVHVNAATRATLQAFLAAVAGAVATAAEAGGDINWQGYLFNIGLAFSIAIATHFGLLVPTGTANKIANATAKVGFGRDIRQTPPPTPANVAITNVAHPPTVQTDITVADINVTTPGQPPTT